MWRRSPEAGSGLPLLKIVVLPSFTTPPDYLDKFPGKRGSRAADNTGYLGPKLKIAKLIDAYV